MSTCPDRRREPRVAVWHAAVPALLSSVFAGGFAEAQAPTARGVDREMTAEVRLAIRRGFDYLLLEQRATGSFRSAGHPVALNALVGLAYLAGGTTTEEGANPEHVAAVATCLEAILSYQRGDGFISANDPRGMYGHGFATLFLAEVYGLGGSRDAKIRTALRNAVRLIERSQRSEGGWDYSPNVNDNPFGGSSDTSITVCQTMALRAARNLGVRVSDSVVEQARKYIRGAQNSDGGFRYRSVDIVGMTGSAFPRSAAGVCILYSLGDYSSIEIQRGIRYLEAHYRRSNEYPFYAQYYCAQAMFQVGGQRWSTYWQWVSDRLIQDQRQDGSWRSRTLQMEKEPVQTTAMALIVLQVPYRLLPIHER